MIKCCFIRRWQSPRPRTPTRLFLFAHRKVWPCLISFFCFYVATNRKYALTYSMVHCNYVSLGQSLMPTWHVDNFLIPCFCRKFFEDRHPSISGRDHFYPTLGVCSYFGSESIIFFCLFFMSLFFVCITLPLLCHFGHVFVCSLQENILNYQDDKLRSIATSFLGAASASRGKRLDLSNTVCSSLSFFIYFFFFCLCSIFFRFDFFCSNSFNVFLFFSIFD